ncbi:MAG: hypothetical protein WC942_10390 [Clostridia bacterium]|jgi:hypothetical protein
MKIIKTSSYLKISQFVTPNVFTDEDEENLLSGIKRNIEKKRELGFYGDTPRRTRRQEDIRRFKEKTNTNMSDKEWADLVSRTIQKELSD